MGSHDHLAALLENSLNIDDVQHPTILMGAMIADELPNIGGIKGSLRSSWSGFGNFQISHLRRNIFCIKMNQEGAKRYSVVVLGMLKTTVSMLSPGLTTAQSMMFPTTWFRTGFILLV